MEDHSDPVVTEITQKQVKRLVDSLASMRNFDEADVILICENVEFPAHRLVLKASCPYFSGMFQSNMRETKADKIVIEQVDHEAMGPVLEYLYVGKVPEISSADFLIKVTEASHLFQLTELFDYCCSKLVVWLSGENYDRMFSIAALYGQKEALDTATGFIISNIDNILADTRFLNFSYEDLTEFLNVAKDNFHITEELLLGVINWICHDVGNREKYAGELMKCINMKCLRREFMKLLLDCEEIKDLSMELSSKIKDLSVDVFYELSACYFGGYRATSHDVVNENCLGTNLVLFSDYRMELSFDTSINHFVKRRVSSNCLQQLDLWTMSWCPPVKLPFSGFKSSAMCQHRNCIYVVGGELESNYIMYNVVKNTVRYVPCNHFNGLKGGQLLPLHDHIYFVDECFNVTRISPGKDLCVEQYFTIHQSWIKPTVFATTNWIYVSYFDSMDIEKCLKIIRFADMNDQMKHQSLSPIPDVSVGTSVFFAVSSNSNIIYGFYNKGDCLVRARNRNAQIENWEIQEFPMGPGSISDVFSVYKTTQTALNVAVLVAAEGNKCGIPNYMLQPDTCKWVKLPTPKWKCEIPSDVTPRKVYFTEI